MVSPILTMQQTTTAVEKCLHRRVVKFCRATKDPTTKLKRALQVQKVMRKDWKARAMVHISWETYV